MLPLASPPPNQINDGENQMKEMGDRVESRVAGTGLPCWEAGGRRVAEQRKKLGLVGRKGYCRWRCHGLDTFDSVEMGRLVSLMKVRDGGGDRKRGLC